MTDSPKGPDMTEKLSLVSSPRDEVMKRLTTFPGFYEENMDPSEPNPHGVMRAFLATYFDDDPSTSILVRGEGDECGVGLSFDREGDEPVKMAWRVRLWDND